MDRKPLQNDYIITDDENGGLTGNAEFLSESEYALHYSFTGKLKNEEVKGILLEFFPDDRPGRYFDIERAADGKIDIGYLSEKSFNEKKKEFSDHYKKIKDTLNISDDSVLIFSANNTNYIFINEKSSFLPQKNKENLFGFMLQMSKIACIMTDNGLVSEFNNFIRSSDGGIIPLDQFNIIEKDEDVAQQNILNFGLMFYRLLFGKEASLFDRRRFSVRNKNETEFYDQMSDEEFSSVCGILDKTISISRIDCYKNFTEVSEALQKII